eukprot:2117599-Rhodomonas_salina.1
MDTREVTCVTRWRAGRPTFERSCTEWPIVQREGAPGLCLISRCMPRSRCASRRAPVAALCAVLSSRMDECAHCTMSGANLV